MNPSEFKIWLTGFLDAITEPTPEQIQTIRDKLATVQEPLSIAPYIPLAPQPYKWENQKPWWEVTWGDRTTGTPPPCGTVTIS